MSLLFTDADRQLLDNGARTELVVSEANLQSTTFPPSLVYRPNGIRFWNSTESDQ